MKKYISILLCITILLSIFPISLQATDVSGMTDEQIRQMLKNNGHPLTNTAGRPIDIAVYKKYDLVVYGDPGPHGPTDKYGEREYLGYNYMDLPVTNDAYLAVPFDDLLIVNYISFPDAMNSWPGTIDPDQWDQLFYYKPIVDENKPVNYSVAEIMAKKATTAAQLKQYVMLQVLPTLYTKGSVRVMYKTANGNIFHNTFIVPELAIPFSFDCGVSISAGSKYTLQPGQEYIDIPVQLTGSFQASKPPSEFITMVKFTFENTPKLATVSNPTANYTKRVYAKDLKVGENPLTLQGTGYYESKYGDKLTRNDSTKIIVVKPDPTSPTVDLTATINPESVKFSDSDVQVKIDLDSMLYAYTDLANIKEVKFYARFKESAEAQSITLTPRLAASGSFNFTIPKDKIVGDSFDQYFVTTVQYVMKVAVNSKTIYDATTELRTNVYKEAPKPPANLPPTVRIDSPNLVVQGNPIEIKAVGSDPQGASMQYYWNVNPSAWLLGILTGTESVVSFSQPGTVTVKVDGESVNGVATDSKPILVLPATPNTILLTKNSRVNHKITADASTSTSKSPAYPIDWSKSEYEIWVEDGSKGLTINDIKTLHPNTIGTNAAGQPSMKIKGNFSKIDLLSKKEGKINIHCTLYSTSGYSSFAMRTVNIGPDLPPVAKYWVTDVSYRDPADNLLATFELVDLSEFTDGDPLAKRVWLYCFDSDNDGSFEFITQNGDTTKKQVPEYEPWYVYHNGGWVPVRNFGIDGSYQSLKDLDIDLINDGNKAYNQLKVNHVGAYRVHLIIRESLDMTNSIPELVTPADAKTESTLPFDYN